MKFTDLKPLSVLATGLGAKVLLYGPPGTGKTPMIASLPNSVMCCVENGLSSVKNSSTLAKDCYNFNEFDDYYRWFVGSKEADQFQTGVFDSLTQIANLALEEKKRVNSHGMKAYGEMAEYVLGVVHKLCLIPKKNIIFTAQMATEEIPLPNQGPFTDEPETFKYNRPLFPGRVLSKQIPHSIDEILYVHNCRRPDPTNSFGPAIATTDTGTAMARSRCGKLAPLEPADLNYLFSKINS